MARFTRQPLLYSLSDFILFSGGFHSLSLADMFKYSRNRFTVISIIDISCGLAI